MSFDLIAIKLKANKKTLVAFLKQRGFKSKDGALYSFSEGGARGVWAYPANKEVTVTTYMGRNEDDSILQKDIIVELVKKFKGKFCDPQEENC